MKKIIKKVLGKKLILLLKNLFLKPLFSEADLIKDFFDSKNIVGTMLDVGVHYGESFIDYAKNGWIIFGVEPNPICIASLPKYDNFKLYQNAASDIDDQDVTLYTSTESTGITSLIPFNPDHKPFVTVKTITLKTIIQKENIKKIDFLKIDIEGYDFFALKGFPFEVLKPSIIICEFEDKKTRNLGYTYKDLAKLLLDQDYKVYVSEWFPIKKYGVQHDWKDIRSYAGSLLDENGWGNFIAIKNEFANSFDEFLTLYVKKYKK